MTGRTVRGLAYDESSGMLWAVTEAGVNARVPSAEQWLFAPHAEAGTAAVSEVGIGNAFVWFRGGGALFRTGRLGDRFERAAGEEAEADGVRWKGGRSGGVTFPMLFMEGGRLFDPRGRVLDPSLREYAVAASLEDRFRDLWMAFDGLGLGRADLNTQRLEMLPYGLYSADVNAVILDGDALWAGGFHHPDREGGITRWDRASGAWAYYEARYTAGLRSDQVTCACADTDAVWFGTTDGLVRFDKAGGFWNSYGVHQNLWSNEVNILAAGDSSLWVGTELGLNRLRLPGPTVERITDPRLVHRAVYDCEDDGEGSLWLATDRGAFRLDTDSGALEALKGYPGLLATEARAVSVWEREVWFATDGGIECLDRATGEWDGFPKNQYPTGGQINFLAADSGAVWAGTEEGALKYLKSENRWRRFTVEDGLLDDSVRWVELDGDALWFGTAGGLSRFYWNAPYRTD
jgi:hypothetical protein